LEELIMRPIRVSLIFVLLLGFGWLWAGRLADQPASAAATDDLFIYLPLIERYEPPQPAAPWIEPGEITITAYQYDHPDCQIATAPGDPIYPYPRLNHDCVMQKPTQQRTFTAITLHNEYAAVTVLPELGGRLYRWLDKTTGRQLFYNNPVLKPTAWGYRGWWLATGGIEWAFPTDEHGLNEYRPWVAQTAVSPQAVSLTLSDLESRTGMRVGVTLTLDAAHSYLTIKPWVENETAVSHSYQYWLNAMIALDGNQAGDGVEFILPASEIVIHSTGDPGLPGEHGVVSWPVYNGRSLNLYHTWNGWIGFFAPTIQANYSGIYDYNADQGVLRVFDRQVIPGHKYFGPGTLGSGLWTDDGSSYVEMWSSGVTPDFWTYVTLAAGERAEWLERWYPVSAMPGFAAANEYGALHLAETWQGIEVGVLVTAVTPATLQLYANDTFIQSWPLTLSPGPAWQTLTHRPPGLSGPLSLRLLDQNGATLLVAGGL
jgi:hypothetical protein